ncbi:AAA family ATPase [Methylocystis parvus]|uniref:AAA family ATPase n=1 Tax=Methylocystis parvus TaxID=134 RepID=UPI003C712763
MLAYLVRSTLYEARLAVIGQALVRQGCEVHHVDSIEAAINDGRIAGRSNALIVVPESGDSKADVARIAHAAASMTRRAFIMYVASTLSPEDYKTLTRLGSAESTDWDAAIKEIAQLIPSLQKDAGVKSDSFGHRLITFVGTGAGGGNTTIAMETAVSLASMKGGAAGNVALFDLELADSVVCSYLDIKPHLDWDELSHNPERIDGHMLGILASRHESGLDVFASIAPPQTEIDIGGIAVLTMLNRLIELYDVVILDVPSSKRRDVDEILRNSDLVVVTGLYSIPAAKNVGVMLKKFAQMQIPPNRVATVITDAEVNLFGRVAETFDISKLIGPTPPLFVRRDRAFAIECANAGLSMVASQPKRGICTDIAKIAERVLTVAPVAAAMVKA